MMPSRNNRGLNVHFGLRNSDGTWTRHTIEPKHFDDDVAYHLEYTLGVQAKDIPEMKRRLEKGENVEFESLCAKEDLISLGYAEEE
jgi:hypothetical protein